MMMGLGFSSVVAAGGSTVTFDPATKSTHITLSGGNLTAASDSNANAVVVRTTTSHSSGKYYAEFTIVAGSPVGFELIGICTSSYTIDGASFLGNTNSSLALGADGQMYTAVSGASNGGLGTSTYTTADVISVAVDLDNKKMWWRKNGGSWYGDGIVAGDPGVGNTHFNDITNLSTGVFLALEVGNAHSVTANFGGSAYAQSVPSGYSNW